MLFPHNFLPFGVVWILYFNHIDNMNELLNVEEKNELERCEVVIKQGLKTFVEVGQALMLIRDKRLYRSEFGTFENYCRDKWDLTRRYVNNIVAASNVVSNLEMGTMVPKPQNERQARPLTKLEPELQQEAWQETINRHGSEITQKKVQIVVNEFVDINNKLKQAKKEPLFGVSEKEILAKAREIRESRKRKKKEYDNVKVEIPIPDGEYNLIYCDPPWRYDFSNTDNRKIENHYPTMDLSELKNLQIPASENCVLLMWATAPKLKEAFEVIEAWGFEYKTQSIWDKKKIGMGYWFRGQHEILMVATKGKCKPPEPCNRFASVHTEERTKHSKKPMVYYEMIKQMFPTLKKIELFSRCKVEGFDNWGNEIL